MSADLGRRRHPPGRLLRLLAIGAAGALLAVVSACSAMTTPAQSGTKFTDTVTQASLAYVQVSWRGWVVLPRDVDVSSTEYIAKGVYGPFTAVTSCSGFVASRSGDIVTAGHCVDATSFYGGKGAILAAMFDGWTHANGRPLTPAQQARQAQIVDANGSVEGFESGSPVERTVKITVPALSAQSHPANVVAVEPFTQGDAALLRAAGVVAPALPVAQAGTENGDSVVAAGYPGDVAKVVDSTTPASFNQGSVSGTQTVNGTPFTQISAQVSPGMSGGPVVNMAGQVVGTVSWAPNGTTAANFMTDTGTIRSLLAGNGVSTKLTPAGRTFRLGLAYYFARRYHEAVTQFNQSLALQPGQPIAKKYQQQAIARYPQDVNPPNKGLPLWSYVVIGVAVLALAGGAVILVMRRRRAGPSGEKPAGLAPAPAPTQPVPPAPESAPTQPIGAMPVQAPTPAPPAQVPPAASVPASRPAPEAAHHFCPNCGQEHAKDAHYCERCGQPFPSGLPVEHGKDEGIRA